MFQVSIEVELESQTLSLKVSPGQATVLMAFESRPHLTLHELTRVTGTMPSTARKLVAFWIGKGVIREVSPDGFEVCEQCDGLATAPLCPSSLPPPLEDEAESAMAPAEQQRDEELQVRSFIQYIINNIIIYRDLLIPPRTGSHVKSDNTHTQTHTIISTHPLAHILHICALIFSSCALFIFIPTASCNNRIM